VWQHRSGQVEATGAPASCTQLVWHAEFSTLEEAEEQLERLSRWPEAWTNRLIEENNPEWIDLWANLEGQPAIGISPAFSANSHNTDTLYPILRPMLKVA